MDQFRNTCMLIIIYNIKDIFTIALKIISFQISYSSD